MAKRGHNAAVGRQVGRLVAELDLDTASPEAVAAVAERVRELGRPAVTSLARMLLKPGRREAAAAVLCCLSGEEAGWAAEALEEALATRRLSPMEQACVTVAAQGLHEAALPREAGSARRQAPPAAMEPQPFDVSELLLWRDELLDLPPAQRRAMLAQVIESGDPAYLPVLEVALSLGDAGLDEAIAQGLGRFATAQALPLVRELPRRPDPAARALAREALVALARRGVASRDAFVAEPEAEGGPSRGFTAEQGALGTLLAAVAGREADGLWYYVVVVLDPIEEGLREAWGETGLSETQVRAQLGWLAEDHGLALHPVELNVAQALVAAGEDYTRRQGRELPADYVVWRRKIGRPTGSVVLPVAFGPACVECGARLRLDDLERGGLAAGEAALCGACAQAPRACAGCGRELQVTFDDYAVRVEGGELRFECRRCASKRRRGRPAD